MNYGVLNAASFRVLDERTEWREREIMTKVYATLILQNCSQHQNETMHKLNKQTMEHDCWNNKI